MTVSSPLSFRLGRSFLPEGVVMSAPTRFLSTGVPSGLVSTVKSVGQSVNTAIKTLNKDPCQAINTCHCSESKLTIPSCKWAINFFFVSNTKDRESDSL